VPINLFGKRRAPAQPVRPDVARALEQLGKLAEAQPELAELAAGNAALLRAAFADVPIVAPLPFPAAHAAAKLEAGVPLLRGEALALPGNMLRQRYEQLCDALAQQPGTNAATRANATALRNAVARNTLDVHALVVDVLAGDPHTVAERAAAFDLDAGVAATLLRWTLLPLLEQYSKQLAPLREHMPWQHGYCPTCGAWPIFAEQRGIEQRRYLRCGLCATDWAFERILCPFCGTRHHADIQWLFEAGHDDARAVTCERCHGYFKQINALVPTSTVMLPVADLQTVHLDLVALERAYAPPV
jgi:FdhE protein